jgi:hypothetical protein
MKAGTHFSAEQLQSLREETVFDLLAQGLLRPVKTEYQEKRQPEIDPSILAQLDAAPRPAPHYGDIYQANDPAHSTRLLRMIDDMRGPDFGFHTTIAPLTAYECARFQTTRGEWGIIKGIYTWIEFTDGEPVPIGPGPCGTPYDPRILARNSVWIRWAIRLADASQDILPGTLITPPAQMPGCAPYELGYWDDLRFAWGAGNGVFLAVPPNTRAHLFGVTLAGSEVLAAIGGRLQGYTQTIRSPEAEKNASMGWNW